MTLQHFHLFPDLPRELQLHIWDIHEADNFPHFRHYFRCMVYYDGRLYAAADLNTGRQVQSWNRSRVDFPYARVHLPGDQHWFSKLDSPSAHNFGSIQDPLESDEASNHICVNLKYDEFCFANGTGGGDAPDHLEYLKGAVGLPGSSNVDRSHWFFSIQHLGLITAPGRSLTPFDRQLLTGHPSLKSITIIVTPSALRCGYHPKDGYGYEVRNRASLVERIPLNQLTTFLTALDSCGCGAHHSHAKALESLRQELLDLFGQRLGRDGVRMRLPTVMVEVELTEFERDDLLCNVAGQEGVERERNRREDMRAAPAELGRDEDDL